MYFGVEFFRPRLAVGYQNYHGVHLLTFYFVTIMIGREN